MDIIQRKSRKKWRPSTPGPRSESAPPRRRHGNPVDPCIAITWWLKDDVIGFDAAMEEMETYADCFVSSGLHSIAMIQEMVTPADVIRFTFMKEFHKRRLFQFLRNHSDMATWNPHLSSICCWLRDEVITYGADHCEMGLYAQKLVDLGFQSPKMICDTCTQHDVLAWLWMKPVHKRLFLSRTTLRKSVMP